MEVLPLHACHYYGRWCMLRLWEECPKYWYFTLFAPGICSFPPKKTGCELLQAWHVMNCHHKHHRSYKYLWTKNEADALVLLWPLRETIPCNRWRQHLRLAFDLQECVFSLSTGWTQMHTSWRRRDEIYSAQLRLHPWLRWWSSTKFCPPGPCRNVLTQTGLPLGAVISGVQVRMRL